MKIPSILKRFGGADIKLKTKLSWKKKLLLLLLSVVLFSCLGYYFTDHVVNGLFVDWFTKNFTYTETRYNAEYQMDYIYEGVNWSDVKAWIAFAGGGFLVFTAALVFVTAVFYGKRKEKESISKAGVMIHSYMEKNVEADEIFPGEYAEISAQMIQIKTDMEKKEQNLKQEAQQKSDLITYLAHDLKTPLTSVIGYLALLDEVPDMPEKQKEKYIRIALSKANRLDSLISEFFEITQYNLQNIWLEKEKLDLTYMLLQMKEEFYPLLSAHGNTMELNMPEDCVIYADADRLARVFNNLLKNAVAYSYAGSVIFVSGKQEENHVILDFESSGKTIPKEKLDKLFQKFFRMDDARRTNTGGAGLGLAIAKEIVELHGGRISANSQSERTVFTVVLPKTEETAQAYSSL